MRKYFFPYIATIFLLSLLFIACNSNPQPAVANPAPPPDEPTKVLPSSPLQYADTTQAEYKAVFNRLDGFFRRFAGTGFNGSVLVGHNGKVLYERYFGMANRETGLRLRPNSAVQLASVSKTFTGTAVLYLHQHNFININHPVQEYLPTFPYPNITVKMLLNHRSGLPDYYKWIPAYRKDQKTPINNNQMLDMFIRYKPGLEFRPDARFKYSNSNYAFLALVIEAATDMRYPDFMRKFIFEPLGMKNTFVYEAEKGLPATATISYGRNWAREPVMFADGVDGDKGIYSTVQDMYRWDQSFYNHALLNRETLAMAYAPYSFEKKGVNNYGLGWRMKLNPGKERVIYHNGWWHGNNTVFYRFVEQNITIIMLGNKYNASVYKQAPVVYGLVKNMEATGDFESEE
ncbi:MAG: beta-lactamase [Flavipsychrobacter sp.]|jgi:CubicO group peptidase (beta-lactamase class C family)|nr:beta-lactamase [Flavipsychrobacter sp.]